MLYELIWELLLYRIKRNHSRIEGKWPELPAREEGCAHHSICPQLLLSFPFHQLENPALVGGRLGGFLQMPQHFPHAHGTMAQGYRGTVRTVV